MSADRRDREPEALREKEQPDNERLSPQPDRPREHEPKEREPQKERGRDQPERGEDQSNREGKPSDRDGDKKAEKPRRRGLYILIGAVVLAIGVPAGYLYWENGSHFEVDRRRLHRRAPVCCRE